MIYYYRHISENELTGAQRWELSPAAADAIREFLDARGEDFETTVRALRWTADGLARFTTGVGYEWRDADLLGGDGSGARSRELYDAGVQLQEFTGDRRRREDRELWQHGRREWRDDHAADDAEYRAPMSADM